MAVVSPLIVFTDLVDRDGQAVCGLIFPDSSSSNSTSESDFNTKGRQ